ncbi:hypothetical protein GCK32_016274 [Trichostrongylus colubriformis]|uniref:Uncharacterized protein n=1 Tax=Trichostrongylus colubriformis TaxID=6319 RepID=A0AAN8EMG7_TRICO
MESRMGRSFGLKNMGLVTRKKVLAFVLPFIREMQACLLEIHDNVEQSHEIALRCREIFLERYTVLLDAQNVYTFGRLIMTVASDYINNMSKVVMALRKFIFENRAQILDWHDYNMELKTFETLYREGGADNLEVHELMKLRKLMVTDVLEYITPLSTLYNDGLRARESARERFGFDSLKPLHLDIIESTTSCLLKISDDIPLLKIGIVCVDTSKFSVSIKVELLFIQKSAFIRGEWLSRIQKQVEIAQSYFTTPQYDQ